MAGVSVCSCSESRVSLGKMKPRTELPFREALYGDNLYRIHLIKIGICQDGCLSDVWLTKRGKIIPEKF